MTRCKFRWRLVTDPTYQNKNKDPGIISQPHERHGRKTTGVLARRRIIPVLLSGLLSIGCAGQGNWGQVSWPQGDGVASALRTAVSEPRFWAPLLAAGLLQIDEADERWSEDLATHQPLFGDDATARSDDLRDLATAAYVVSALAAPSDSAGDKLRGLGLGAAAMVVDGVLNQGLKDIAGRERPDGSNDQSFPSGHASKASSRTELARRNLDYIQLTLWQRQLAEWSLHGIAVGTGLARVEGQKHHLGDVLAGYAFGHFVSTFMTEAFLAPAGGASFSLVPVEEGAALTLTIPLRR